MKSNLKRGIRYVVTQNHKFKLTLGVEVEVLVIAYKKIRGQWAKMYIKGC